LKTISPKRSGDHYRFSKSELKDIFKIACARGAAFRIAAEKSVVRIPKEFEPLIPTYFLKIDMEIGELGLPSFAFNRFQ
jgi:hypothetical protein